ncbi:50S ribosomal protein L4 [Patescibacteria group bacterium]|nr:50S ribosomal protein L4 [Patescibacteria group bacterium]
MPTIPVYNQKGEKTKSQKVEADIFECPLDQALVHRVLIASLAQKRHPLAHALFRGEVRGGGKKPWRQKGTGRARAGSIRSPLWKGGGVTFGPRKERKFAQKINKKEKRKALFICLSDKLKEKKIYVLDQLELPEIKTKKFVEILKNISLGQDNKKILLALPVKDDKIIKSARNIKGIRVLPVIGLNVLDLLKTDYLLTTALGIKKIEEHWGAKVSKKEKTKKTIKNN